MRIRIGEDPGLQHPVRRVTNAAHEVGRTECELLDLGEVVPGIPIELQHADIDRWKVRLRPDLGNVERIEREGFRLPLGHHLQLDGPLREIARFNRSEQGLLIPLAGTPHDRFRLGVGVVTMSLAGLEMELHPDALALVVPQAVGMTAVAIHVHGAGRQATIREERRYLVKALR